MGVKGSCWQLLPCEMERGRKDWLQNTCVPDMAFIMELGDKSSGNMPLLQAGSTAVPGNLPATHLSVFIFLQGGWPWALYSGQTNWLQGKTWPWSLWERWAKEHPLKHFDSWHIASHINHMRAKKSQGRWEIYQDAHLLAFLDLWDSKEMLHKSQNYHNSYCWDCHIQEVWITMNHRFQCFTSASRNLQLTAEFVSVSCPEFSICLELHHSFSKTCCPQALHMPVVVYHLSLLPIGRQVFKKNGWKTQEMCPY